MLSDCFVSVVAPLHNQAPILAGFVDELLAVLRATYANYEVVLVDDGSSDDTAATMAPLLGRHECIRYVRLSRHFGEEIAIAAGLDSVIGDYVVVMLPETDPPQLIPAIVELARKDAAIVFGVRRTRGDEPLWSALGAALFYWYDEHVLRLGVPRNSTQYRVLSRQAVNAIIRIKEKYRYLRVSSGYVGYGHTSFTYDEISRSGRPRRREFLRSLNQAIDIVVANSTHPLRLVTMLGVIASVLNVLYVGYVVTVFLVLDQVAEGWTTTSLQIAGMFFFLFLILTVLSEYIGRILAETRDRPLYYVLDERNSATLVEDQDRRNVVKEPFDVDA